MELYGDLVLGCTDPQLLMLMAGICDSFLLHPTDALLQHLENVMHAHLCTQPKTDVTDTVTTISVHLIY